MKIPYLLHDTPFIGENQQYHYMYKIVNKLNGHYYYGIHSTANLDDGYRGSGKRIKQAIRKYGIENFVKHIISFHHTRQQLSLTEATIINDQLLKDQCSYNIALGGENNVSTCMADNRKTIIQLETGNIIESVSALRKITNNTHINATDLDHFVDSNGHHYAIYDERLDNQTERDLLIEQIDRNIKTRYRASCQSKSIARSQQWIDLKTLIVYENRHEMNEQLQLQLADNIVGRRFKNHVIKLRGHYFTIYDDRKSSEYYRELFKQTIEFENRDRQYYQSRKVQCVETGQIFNSCREASRSLGLSARAVTSVVNGYQKTAGRYHWKLVDE